MQLQSAIEKKITSAGLFAQERNLMITEDFLYSLSRLVVGLYTRNMLEMDVQWHSLLPDGPKILAPNHPTTMDPIYLLSLLSEPASFLVAAAAFDIPLVGHYLRIAGHVPAVRGSGGATVDALIRKVLSGRNIAIFPEGALSPLAGGFHRPHSGVARIALRTGAPVIPIGIGLRRDCIHVTRAKVKGDEAVGHFYLNGPYAITVGKPMYFTGDVQDRRQVRSTANLVMHHIKKLAFESEDRIQSEQPGTVGTLDATTYQWVPIRNSR